MNFGGSARQSGWPSHSQGKKGTLPDMRRAPPQAIAESSRTGTRVQGVMEDTQASAGGYLVGPARASCQGPLAWPFWKAEMVKVGESGARGSVHSARRSGVAPKGRDCLALLHCTAHVLFPEKHGTNHDPTFSTGYPPKRKGEKTAESFYDIYRELPLVKILRRLQPVSRSDGDLILIRSGSCLPMSMSMSDVFGKVTSNLLPQSHLPYHHLTLPTLPRFFKSRPRDEEAG
jgi:hypothetical protein